MTHDDDWLPEHVAGLTQMIRELWPNSGEEAAENLSAGIMHLVRKRRLRPGQVFPTLVEAAEDGGRERIISVASFAAALGRRRARREGAPPASERNQIEPRAGAQPWAPALWTAAFVVAGGRERLSHVPAELLTRLRPWLDLVHRLGLKPVHGIEGPDADEPRVAQAHRDALDVWRTHGGISESAALKAMGGRW